MLTKFSQRFIHIAKLCLPSPFSLAVILTLITAVLALLFTEPSTSQFHLIEVGEYWQRGFWDLLTFAMQMMLILVLGHVLALTRPATKLIHMIAGHFKTTASASAMVCFFTMCIALLNWGLGLIFGAILARKVADFAKAEGRAINYPIIAASGYACMMIWHSGLSGSATLKVTEANHFLVNQIGQVPLSDTVFSLMNLVITGCVLLLVPLSMFWLGKRCQPTSLEMIDDNYTDDPLNITQTDAMGAEKIDNARWFSLLLGGAILAMAFYIIGFQSGHINFNALNLNLVNFILLGLGLALYPNIRSYCLAVDEAIVGSAGIMIQFPLYAGIAGIIQYSGLIHLFSDFIVNVSTENTYPLFTLLSAGIVNVFVPSGGGQWAVQGPILAEAAQTLNVPVSSSIMAFAYGDQLTNMMQPFWALPLLGITKLKAQDILPYCLFLMLVGGIIFAIGLWVF